MDRRVLAIIGLVVLVLLAGCSYDTTIAVLPEVDDVESNEDTHEIQVTVDPDLENVEEIVSDVEVNGYSLDSERVCSAAFGDVADNATRTLECERFPSVLVADTPDRGERVPPANDNWLSNHPDYTIVTMASAYRGYENETHQFELFATNLERNRKFNVTDGRAAPTDGTYRTMQCRQWQHQWDGRNFSALEDASWLEWELRTLEAERYYDIDVANYSHHEQHNQTDRFDLDPAGNTSAESDVPRALSLLIRGFDGGSATNYRGEFREVVDGLSSAAVNASENTTAAMRGIDGRYGTYEEREITCGAPPPQQSGDRGEYVKTYVTYDGYTYHVTLMRGETFEGDAFENVTAA